jgi:hypothetical protein
MHRGYRAISAVGQQQGITVRGANRYGNAVARGHQSIAFTRAANLLRNQHKP